MPTIFNYYTNDFSNHIGLTLDINLLNNDSINFLKIGRKAVQESTSDARSLVYYIPSCENTFEVIDLIIKTYESQINDFKTTISSSFYNYDLNLGDIKKYENIYSRHIYIYHESDLDFNSKLILTKLCDSNKIIITLRSREYVKNRIQEQKPIAFISHDSRDKDLIARPIYSGLANRLTTVWFDEYSLQPGQSLRESIEKGIKEAKKCILILTPNFLTNSGWTKKEFDSIFTREMIYSDNILLPIWFNVTPNEVYEYSPSLADRIALIWPKYEEGKKAEYEIMVQELITKIHYNLLE